ncbi:MAG TPA: GIY-YIG nuclease family protein, partial [Patescibacteria group bacterium]|nr:GIY-YIG nuclease family protein [Patescibacteria group bacterium]
MNLKKLPQTPGVYLFKNNRNKIIYVGKAVNLRNRVSSYFAKGAKLLPRTKLLVASITGFEFIRVESEIEALILEANLIKKHRPYYNVRLKDDKDYLYIKITKEDFPTVQLARSKDLKGSKRYFGPFPDSRAARTTYKLLRKLFPYRTCIP